MDIITMVLLAVGLSMDCLAVAVAIGLSIKNVSFIHALKIGIYFGGFQTIMPILGWLFGLTLIELISSIDHWIAFLLLSVIGGKMIYEAFSGEGGSEGNDTLKHHTLLLLSIATSIDALAVGLSFSFLRISVVIPIAIIGLVAFLFSFAGVMVSSKLGSVVGNRIRILGGLILIAIGLRILIEHIFG
jgi:putative Mn2+ efflux pump MntP